MFTVFGIQQRRQGLLSANIQIRQYDFDAVARTLSTITLEDLRRAAEDEWRGERTRNPAIDVLKQNVTATAKRVRASGPSRTQLRSQIFSAAIYFNQPSIWLTICPDRPKAGCSTRGTRGYRLETAGDLRRQNK
jgi:hypothetical protein